MERETKSLLDEARKKIQDIETKVRTSFLQVVNFVHIHFLFPFLSLKMIDRNGEETDNSVKKLTFQVNL